MDVYGYLWISVDIYGLGMSMDNGYGSNEIFHPSSAVVNVPLSPLRASADVNTSDIFCCWIFDLTPVELQ